MVEFYGDPRSLPQKKTQEIRIVSEVMAVPVNMPSTNSYEFCTQKYEVVIAACYWNAIVQDGWLFAGRFFPEKSGVLFMGAFILTDQHSPGFP